MHLHPAEQSFAPKARALNERNQAKAPRNPGQEALRGEAVGSEWPRSGTSADTSAHANDCISGAKSGCTRFDANIVLSRQASDRTETEGSVWIGSKTSIARPSLARLRIKTDRPGIARSKTSVSESGVALLKASTELSRRASDLISSVKPRTKESSAEGALPHQARLNAPTFLPCHSNAWPARVKLRGKAREST